MNLAEANAETKIIQDFEMLRRHEYDLITELLDVLPKIDNLEEQHVGQVRDALFHADHPFLMVFVGPFSSGKSSIINALLGTPDLLRIGPVPTTDRISILRWGEEAQHMGTAGDYDTVFFPSPLLKKVSFVDTPGLESVFEVHEQTTRNFLHRSDVVFLVMLATQAMTQSNLDTLHTFKDYGKKVILVINQADLLNEDEQQSVRDYVLNQSKDRLGFTPTIWMVSARLAQEAGTGETRDKALWDKSNMGLFEAYIEKQLGDAERLRQKLQTPLQIVQNAHRAALSALRGNQSRFDQYRNIAENIDQQLAGQRRAQGAAVREINEQIALRFSRTAERSGEALQNIFQFSRALSSLGGGLLELTGLSRFFRRGSGLTYIQQTFEKYKAFEPINELPEIVDKLPARLEGQDMQDIDALVKYGHKELNSLPVDIRDKVIGTVQAPLKYDRSPLLSIRPQLQLLEDEARLIETQKLDQIRRNTLLYLAIWELIVVILIVALFNVWGALDADGPISLILLIVLLAASLLGFAMIPLRGRMIHTSYTNRLMKLQGRYTELLSNAADRQIDYGMQLRRDTIAPLMRLVEAQSAIQDEQLTLLNRTEQSIGKIEAGLNSLGKRRILGITL